jgi:hypothetical protein
MGLPVGGNTPTVATYIAKWLRSSDGLFWVSGKPGSGKSTFIKFIANEPKTLGLLSEWSGSKQIIIASYYFWSAGTAMQKSQQGLLSTLLYEIFRQCSEFITPVCGTGVQPQVKRARMAFRRGHCPTSTPFFERPRLGKRLR